MRKLLHLSCIRLAKADDTDPFGVLGEAQDMHPVPEQADCDHPRLAVLLALIQSEHRRVKRKVGSAFKGKPSKPAIAFALGRIEGDTHASDCTYTNPLWLSR